MGKTSSPSLTARQIKAARALLDWSQDDLAATTHLSIATIRKIETGHISPRDTTNDDIRRAFEDAGLEFIEPGGVRHQPEEIRVLQGHNGMVTLYEDIYETVKEKETDIVVVCASELPFSEALGDNRFLHYQRMAKLKDSVKVRCIVEDRTNLPATSYCEYRWISKHYIDSVPFYVYDDKYAIVMFEAEPSPKIVIFKSRITAEAFRRQFYSMWEKATVINSIEKLNIVAAQKTVRR